MCMHLHPCGGMQMCKCFWRPEVGVDSSGIIGSCKDYLRIHVHRILEIYICYIHLLAVLLNLHLHFPMTFLLCIHYYRVIAVFPLQGIYSVSFNSQRHSDLNDKLYGSFTQMKRSNINRYIFSYTDCLITSTFFYLN